MHTWPQPLVQSRESFDRLTAERGLLHSSDVDFAWSALMATWPGSEAVGLTWYAHDVWSHPWRVTLISDGSPARIVIECDRVGDEAINVVIVERT